MRPWLQHAAPGKAVGPRACRAGSPETNQIVPALTEAGHRSWRMAVTRSGGHAERRAALDMMHRHSPGSTRRLTLGADMGFDSAELVADFRPAPFRAETIPRIVS